MMNCPLCNKEMRVEKYEGVDIDVCSDCGGTWLDNTELGKIIDTEEEKFIPSQIKEALKETAEEKENRGELMRRIMSFKKDVSPDQLNADGILATFRQRWGEQREVKCPKCGNAMEEFEYAGIGVMLDRCLQGHGFWLDRGELEKIQIMMEHYKKMFTPSRPASDMKLTEKKCPACNDKLVEKDYEQVPVDICSKCGGVWLDKDELYQIVERKEQKFSEEEKAEVSTGEVKTSRRPELVGEVNCPICGDLTKRLVYACISGIIIDRCSHGHGVWLDKDELEKIQIYVEKSDDQTEKEYAKCTRILNQARLDYGKRREEATQDIKVSRFEAINRMARWVARKVARKVD